MRFTGRWALIQNLPVLRHRTSTSKQRLNVTAAPYDVEDQYVLSFNAVDDDVLAHGKLRKPGRKS